MQDVDWSAEVNVKACAFWSYSQAVVHLCLSFEDTGISVVVMGTIGLLLERSPAGLITGTCSHILLCSGPNRRR